MSASEPDRDCPLCPRLVAFRQANRAAQPAWFNAPVPTLGARTARLLVVGLAPGLRGANRTGRPFTADFAGDLLYPTLLKYGFAAGSYERRPDDGLVLRDCAITNAVRCVPPQNKPTPAETRTCRAFLDACLQEMTALRAVVALGRIAHDSLVRAFGGRLTALPFAHGARHDVDFGERSVALFDTYHCSRYNTSTRLLTEAMFRDIFADVQTYLDAAREA